MFLQSRLTQQECSNPPAEPGITAHYSSFSHGAPGLEVNENPEEITVKTNAYTVDWDPTKSDIGADIELDSGHQPWSAVAVKSALNRCWEEMSLTLVRERKGET